MAAYTVEEVDELIGRLERNAARQAATLNNPVKGVTAEVDLLKTAEVTRDLLCRAVKADKGLLDSIFSAGDCERIGRLRHLLNVVAISEMHGKDLRWSHLAAIVASIESVLKEIGTFKPWVPPSVQAPLRITYKGLRRRLSPGREMSLKPDIEGGQPSNFTVAPSLPADLEISVHTGVITGTLAGGVCHSEATYIVKGSNDAGAAETELVFSVGEKAGPPMKPSYNLPAEGDMFAMGASMDLSPQAAFSGCTFAISPSLPDGLALDAASGRIHGTPSQLTEQISYDIQVRNSSGEASTTICFGIKLTAPISLSYPDIGERLCGGDEVTASPVIQGGAPSTWTVSPDLPQGLSIDVVTGSICGTPECAVEHNTWKITASNAKGEVTCELKFSVECEPRDLDYSAESSGSYAIGEHVSISPSLSGGVGCKFSSEPALPQGLGLDPITGVLSGTPELVVEETSYTISAANSVGSASTVLTFQIVETLKSEDVAGSINMAFAAHVETIEDINEMPPEPSKAQQFGDWMIWIVHRAYLNDPELTVINFSNMHMPPPHVELRIAPKLMKALQTNMHVQELLLVNSNLQKESGPDLAAALCKNKTLKVLNLEANWLEAGAIREISQGIAENPCIGLEHLRVMGQKQAGSLQGRTVEEAIGRMMEKNESIIKLGFECGDPHYRNLIDRALLRNNDFARRRRNPNAAGEQDVVAEEKVLGRLVLKRPPATPFLETLAQDAADDISSVFWGFVASQKRLPTVSQLQSFAKNSGTPLKYSQVAPLIKDCRKQLLDGAMNTLVSAADNYEVFQEGNLQHWSETNGNWSLTIRTDAGRKFAYRSNKEPVFSISDSWAESLSATAPPTTPA